MRLASREKALFGLVLRREPSAQTSDGETEAGSQDSHRGPDPLPRHPSPGAWLPFSSCETREGPRRGGP